MKTLLAALAIAATFAGISQAAAEAYPSRSITMVVPFSAAGPTDTIARIMAERMGKALGQTVVIENVTGAAGSIGVGRVARAAPDGYTLSIGHWSTHVVNGAVYELSYDLLKDFEPVAMIATNPQLIVTNTSVPATNLSELIAWVRTNQEKVSVGTAGVGSASHVGGIYFQNIIGAKLLFVPYRGTAPAMQDLIAGRIDLMLDQAANSLPWIRSGRIRAYAVTAKTRVAIAPEIPTVDEAGLPGLYIAIWHAIWVPKGTPREIVAKLNAAVVEALTDPTVRQRLAELGQEIPSRDQQTPEALRAYHEAEVAKWWPLIKAAGIKAE
ncbi:MAG TPA: tripartite tricarboxylate transporter substrate-binding protein [Casimicrobiaceae bacterium]|nr:tripartite tricarboxylate transporter substrate-binding protein [Casimicrobiaceae bacterium]